MYRFSEIQPKEPVRLQLHWFQQKLEGWWCPVGSTCHKLVLNLLFLGNIHWRHKRERHQIGDWGFAHFLELNNNAWIYKKLYLERWAFKFFPHNINSSKINHFNFITTVLSNDRFINIDQKFTSWNFRSTTVSKLERRFERTFHRRIIGKSNTITESWKNVFQFIEQSFNVSKSGFNAAGLFFKVR